ncbi:hypothetical protein SprV_0100408100 [Sparganum proliferum]
MTVRATDNGVVPEAFAPTPFSIMFSAMLLDAYCDERSGIRVAYRKDGELFNQQRMNFQSRIFATSFHELLFVHDCARNAIFEGDM